MAVTQTHHDSTLEEDFLTVSLVYGILEASQFGRTGPLPRLVKLTKFLSTSGRHTIRFWSYCSYRRRGGGGGVCDKKYLEIDAIKK